MKKILIVEDESAYARLLHDQLGRKYEVIDAKDGWEGLKLAFSKRPDLILLDLLMPVYDGLKMLNTLRNFTWGKQVPVFVLTNAGGSDQITEAMHSKADLYIVKSEMKLKNLLDKIDISLPGV